MPAVDQLPDLGGLLSEDCPKCGRRPCYEECTHLNDVMLAYYNFENYQASPRHTALAESILNLQDGLLSEICQFELESCVSGGLVGFPCVQCKDVCELNPVIFDCDYSKLELINCVTTRVDFTSTPELQSIYDSVVSALNETYDASVKGVEAYADAVFGVVSEVINYTNGIMYLDLTRPLTADELIAWVFIKESFPIPIGSDICLVSNPVCENYEYSGTSFPLAPVTSPEAITWDGTYYWVADNGTKRVYQFDSSFVATGFSFATNLQDTAMFGITWDGTHLWTLGAVNNKLFKYDTLGVYTGTSIDISGQGLNWGGLTFDGTYFWVVETTNNEVYQYDIAGANIPSGTFSTALEDGTMRGIAWDGSSLWLTGNLTDKTYQYDSGVYTSTFFSTAAEMTIQSGSTWNGSSLVIVGEPFKMAYVYDCI